MTLLLINFNCSGGPGSSDNSGKTMVNISLGKISKPSSTEKRLSKGTSTIPANVVSIRFTISAPDIVTIIRVVSITGTKPISETFEISNGKNRKFLIEALDGSGNVLYRYETFKDLDGSDVILPIEMEATDFENPDTESPDFAGLSEINSITTTSMDLSWLPGNDNKTTPDKLQYLIYRSEVPGGENFTSPGFTTVPGVTSFIVTGLSPDTTYYFVVRAKDEAGNIDSNVIERHETTLSPSDTTAPAFDGVASITAVSSTELNLSWNPAADNITVPSGIVYNIYMSTATGGENLASPDVTTNPGVTSYNVTGLTMGATYYFIVRAKDEAGNIDVNNIEKSAVTQFIDLVATARLTNPCSSTAPCPDFSISVFNNGNIDSGPVNGYYIYESCSDGCFQNCDLPPISITNVPSKQTVLVQNIPIPDTNYYVIIDPDNAITETTKSNNITCSDSYCKTPPSLNICR